MYEIENTKYNVRWNIPKHIIKSDIAFKYMYDETYNDIEKYLHTHVCSYNEAVYFDTINFNYNTSKNTGPFFIYKTIDTTFDGVSVEFQQNEGGFYSFSTIHTDNKLFSSYKKYIVYTMSMVIEYIESKFNIYCEIHTSPFDNKKWLMWVKDKQDNTISFLRNKNGINEFDDVADAATSIYNFYIQYYKKQCTKK